MANPIMARIQEISETVEKLLVQVEDLKTVTKTGDNSEKVEAMAASLDVIKEAVEQYQPYAE
jgi:hypothetical protein